MKQIIGIIIVLFFIATIPVEAHSGRTDSSGGHNCNVGACAGTYHYHNGGSAPFQPQQTYTAPTATTQYVAPTNVPTRISTRITTMTPTPTFTPTPTPEPTDTSTITPKTVQEVKSAKTENPKGFWGWLMNFFRKDN